MGRESHKQTGIETESETKNEQGQTRKWSSDGKNIHVYDQTLRFAIGTEEGLDGGAGLQDTGEMSDGYILKLSRIFLFCTQS